MIRRTDDYSLFSSKEMAKIAQAVKKSENKRLYDTFEIDKVDIARTAVKQLKVQGYHAELYNTGSKLEVYVITPEKVSLKEAEQSGSFKKMAFGRYSFHKSSSLEMHSYNFDDGSIWRIAVDSDGTSILVKEVDDEDDDSPIRGINKTAGTIKIAEVVTISNYRNAAQLLFSNVTSLNQTGNEFLESLFEGPLKTQIIEQLNQQIESYIDNSLSLLNFNQSQVEELKGLISDGISSSQFNTLASIDQFINSYYTSGENSEEQPSEESEQY